MMSQKIAAKISGQMHHSSGKTKEKKSSSRMSLIITGWILLSLENKFKILMQRAKKYKKSKVRILLAA